MERFASFTCCKLKTIPRIFLLLCLMLLICGITVYQKFEYFRIQYEIFQTNPLSFVRPSEMVSSKTHFTFEDFKKITTSRLARRTNDKMTEIPSEKSLDTMPQKHDNKKNRSTEKARGTTQQMDFKTSKKIAKSRLAGRTEDKMKETTTENSLNRMPQEIGEKSFRPPIQDEKDDKIALKHRSRLQQFRENCKKLKCDDKSSPVKYDLFFSSENNLAWKLVPKIGSTFLIQAFGILNKEVNKKVFGKARASIHTGDFSYKKKFTLKKLSNYTVLITARNPFSRLFSAYIDKVYLPNVIDLTREVYLDNVAKVNPGDCQFKTTFNEFLNYALNDKIERMRYGHYGPVLSEKKCTKFCSIPNALIVKQESFPEDVDYALNIVGVKGNKYQNIYNAMHGKNAQITVVGLVKDIYQKMKRDYKKIRSYTASVDCLSWSDVAQRLWKAFQIQGYIRDTVAFPYERFKSNAKYEDEDYLIKVILEEIEKRPLTHEEKKTQRTKALLDAYSEVSEENISTIVETYSYDFSLYDYSTDLKNALEADI